MSLSTHIPAYSLGSVIYLHPVGMIKPGIVENKARIYLVKLETERWPLLLFSESTANVQAVYVAVYVAWCFHSTLL